MTQTAWIVRLRIAVVYGGLGLLATLLGSLGIVAATRPLQPVVYRWSYLALGPSEATELAVLTHLLGSGLVALTGAAVVADGLERRGIDGRLSAVLAGVVGLSVLALVGLARLGVTSPVVAFGLAALVGAGVPVMLWRDSGRRSGAIAAFVGGLPVLAVLLIVAGFGLGWGWGYVVVAEEVPAGTATDDDRIGSFAEAPAVAVDLFDGDNCEIGADGFQRCRLLLRGYDAEIAATRFLADQGVRCPYVNGPAPDDRTTALVRHGETLYRVGCVSHGD
ncbi:MAG: hypothetical protein ABEJ76_03775 [Halanaeroarchaeum sp.]